MGMQRSKLDRKLKKQGRGLPKTLWHASHMKKHQVNKKHFKRIEEVIDAKK